MSDKSLKDKSIDIKGKKYAQVKDRIQWLDENRAGKYSIDTNYDYYPDRHLWVVKAVLTVDGCTYTGLAQEIESDNYKEVNSTSALENCETSAIGRACAAFGLGIQESYASSNEMHKAENRQQQTNKGMTEGQRKWLYDTAAREYNLDNDEDIIKTIESVLTVPIDKIPGWKTKSAVDALVADARLQKSELLKEAGAVEIGTIY